MAHPTLFPGQSGGVVSGCVRPQAGLLVRIVAGNAVFVSGCISELSGAVSSLIQVLRYLIMASEACLRVEKVIDGLVDIGWVGMTVFFRDTFMAVLA